MTTKTFEPVHCVDGDLENVDAYWGSDLAFRQQVRGLIHLWSAYDCKKDQIQCERGRLDEVVDHLKTEIDDLYSQIQSNWEEN